MRCRFLLPLPLALVLGCGAAPPPAATADQPPSTPSASGASAPAGSAAASTPPATPAAQAAAAPRPDGGKPGGAAPPAAPGLAVASDAPIVTKITQDEILALVNQHMDLFNPCYTLGAGTSKSYRAKVTIKATVSPTGAVNAVEIINSNAKNPRVDACVGDGFKKLTFARPKGSGATVFTFPMSFDGIVQVQ